jgi:hypothetical protein
MTELNSAIMKRLFLFFVLFTLMSSGCNKKQLLQTTDNSTAGGNRIKVVQSPPGSTPLEDLTASSTIAIEDWLPLSTSSWKELQSNTLGLSIKMPRYWFVNQNHNFYLTKDEGVSFVNDKDKNIPFIEFIITKTKIDNEQLSNDDYKRNGYFDYMLSDGIIGKRKLSLGKGQKMQWIQINHNQYEYLIAIQMVSDDCGKTIQGNDIFCDYTNDQRNLIKTVLSTLKFVR